MDEEFLKPLKGCILYWESKITAMKAFLSPSEEALILNTIKFLKVLQEESNK